MASASDIAFMQALKSIGLSRATELFELAVAYDGGQKPTLNLSEKELKEVEKVGADFNALIEERLTEKRSIGRAKGCGNANSKSARVREFVNAELANGVEMRSGDLIAKACATLELSNGLVSQAIYNMPNVSRGMGYMRLKVTVQA